MGLTRGYAMAHHRLPLVSHKNILWDLTESTSVRHPDEYHNMFLWRHRKNTAFDLITAHTPISAQSSNFSQCTFIYFFIKTYVVDTHLICLDKSRQFK